MRSLSVEFLQRALADLNEGIRCLLGPGHSRPELVDELLEGRPGRTPPRRARPLPRGAAHSRAHSGPRLVRVK